MPRFVFVRFLFPCLVFCVSACTAGTGAPPQEPPPGQATASLENTLWRLVALGDTAVKAAANLREARFVLASEHHLVQGDTGCNNRLKGTYTLDGESLKIGPVATTRMACPDTLRAEQERAFLKALEGTASYKIHGENLELFDPAGTLLARFESLYLR
jgi:heat shock protein HslJ